MKKEIKLFVGCGVPVYKCNFRCSYCYLTHHPEPYTGEIKPFSQEPKVIAEFFCPERIGGVCYFNFCASGETLFHPQLVELIKLLLEQGHFADIITNGTLSNRFKEIVQELNEEQRGHLLIKFSFHYLELKKRKMLSQFAENVRIVKESGISYSIELTPHDELIPYIEEIKDYSIKTFGALPQVTVARNEMSDEIELLTNHPREKFIEIWSVFNSPLFDFKTTIFGNRRCEFCYAGMWSIQLVLETGEYYQCYGGDLLGNIRDKKIRLKPIGICRQPHCFNGHAYLTFGIIPTLNTPIFLDMRDRECLDASHWVNEDCRQFFSSKLIKSNNLLTEKEMNKIIRFKNIDKVTNKIYRGIIHLPNKFKNG